MAYTWMLLLNCSVSVVAVQLEPFHCSTRAEPPATPTQPTAMQNDVLVQDMPVRNVDVDEGGVDWTTLQVVPLIVRSAAQSRPYRRILRPHRTTSWRRRHRPGDVGRTGHGR